MSTEKMQLPAVRAQAQDLLRDLEAIEQQLGSSVDEEIVYSRLKKAIERCLGGLQSLEIWGPDNRSPSNELWNVAGHFLRRGWLQNQARTKPRGYAGDHELLARIFEQRLCEDPLGRLFDRFFQEQAAPQAVRNRMAMVAGWMGQCVTVSQPGHVAVVGSALGLDVKDGIVQLHQSARQRIRITLLDLDPAAIGFARSQLGALLAAEQLTASAGNVFRLPERPNMARMLRGADIIVCPGLFDYLDDAQAIAMMRGLYGQLAPRGRLIVFQFAPHNPTRAYMEWFGNWYLTYREEGQFRRLVESATLPGASYAYGAEPLGIDLFVCVTKG